LNPVPSGNRSLDDPDSLVGAELDEVVRLIPADWETAPTRREAGMRAYRPGTRLSDSVRVMPGDPTAPDPFHRGPRVIISIRGRQWRIALKGNPVLG
jgi:hypothetical protein